MNKYTAGIIGLGKIAIIYDETSPSTEFQTHSKSLSFHPGFTLKFGIDTDKARRDKFSTSYNCPSYASISNIEDQSVDLLIISTPTHLRLPIIKEALESKPKLILIEKPIATNLEEATQIISLIHDSGAKLYINYHRRCDPGIFEIKNKILSNEWGHPLACKGVYSKGFLNSASHYLDYLSFLYGDIQTCEFEKSIDLSLKDSCINFRATFQNLECEFEGIDDNSDKGEFEIKFEKGTLHFKKQGEEITFVHNSGKNQVISTDMGRCQLNVANHLYDILEKDAIILSPSDFSINLLTKTREEN